MPLDLAARDYVKQLLRAGLRPSERLANNILHGGEAAISPLIDLAVDVGLLDEDPPDMYAPLHALRLLGELRSPRMIEPLLNQLPIESISESDAFDLWMQEVPQILGRLGGAGVAPLWEYADDASHATDARGIALLALAYATAVDESLRDEIVTGLRERLARSDDRDLNAYLTRALSYRGVASAYSEVMARYRAGAVNQEITPAALVRQLILASGRNMLDCAKHPLWERYDEHGPRDQQDEE